MICPNCGSNNPDGTAFCANCGSPVSNGAPNNGAIPPQAQPNFQGSAPNGGMTPPPVFNGNPFPGGHIGAISEHLRQLLAQDVENHLDRKLYDDNLSRSNDSTILKTEFEALLNTAETERQEVREKSPTQPYDPIPSFHQRRFCLIIGSAKCSRSASMTA